MKEKQKSRLFYGYIVAAAGFWVWFIGFGIYGTFGIFFVPVSSEFGWTRADTALASSLCGLMMDILGVFENVIAAAIGVSFAGYLFDFAGNYWPVYWTGLGVAIAGVILASMVKPAAHTTDPTAAVSYYCRSIMQTKNEDFCINSS